SGCSSASNTFQRSRRTGAVKKPQMVCGRAAMRTSRSTTSTGFALTTADPPLLQLGLLLEAGELLVPEPLDEGTQLGQPLRPGTVQPPRTETALHDQPGFLQDAQVLGDGRTGDVEVRRDLPGRALAL